MSPPCKQTYQESFWSCPMSRNASPHGARALPPTTVVPTFCLLHARRRAPKKTGTFLYREYRRALRAGSTYSFHLEYSSGAASYSYLCGRVHFPPCRDTISCYPTKNTVNTLKSNTSKDNEQWTCYRMTVAVAVLLLKNPSRPIRTLLYRNLTHPVDLGKG